MFDLFDRPPCPPLYFYTHSLENNLFQRTSLFSPSSEQRKSLQTDDPVQGGWHYLRLSCHAIHPLSRGANRVGCDYMITGSCRDLTLDSEMYMRARMNISSWNRARGRERLEIKAGGGEGWMHSSDQLFRHTKPILYDVEPRLA